MDLFECFDESLENLFESGAVYRHGANNAELFEITRQGTIFEENGLYGIKDAEGRVLVLPQFLFIGRCPKHILFIDAKGKYEKLFPNGTERGFIPEEKRPFVVNGKAGMKRNGKIIIPAEYDYLSWMFNDGRVFYAVKDGREMYLNDEGKEVLKYIREIEGDDGEYSFPFFNHKKDVIVLQEYVGHPDDCDNNVVYFHGVWQRLDRISGKDVCKLLINPDDEKPLTEKDLELFNNDFSYEYSVYQVTSREPLGIIDCLKKLQLMGLHSNSWHYIVKVWKPEGENPTAEELRFVRYQIEDNEQLGKLHFCLAHDPQLAKGETNMFVVTYYNERCWPAMWEMDWWEERNELSLSQIKRKLTKIHKTINEEILEPYREEVWQDQFWGGIYSIEYNKKRTWKETVKVLNYFKRKGSPIIDGIPREAEKIEMSGILDTKHDFSRAKCVFHFRKLKWLLENGADVNAHYDNHTGLDYFVKDSMYRDKSFSEKEKAYIEQMRKKIINLLLEHGAKTMQQMREEESLNEDYKVELQRMN